MRWLCEIANSLILSREWAIFLICSIMFPMTCRSTKIVLFTSSESLVTTWCGRWCHSQGFFTPHKKKFISLPVPIKKYPAHVETFRHWIFHTVRRVKYSMDSRRNFRPREKNNSRHRFQVTLLCEPAQNGTHARKRNSAKRNKIEIKTKARPRLLMARKR